MLYYGEHRIMNEELDLTSLSRAIASLREVLDRYAADSSSKMLRDSCIKRFEYCYSIAVKHIFSVVGQNPEINKPLETAITAAHKLRIIKNEWNSWKKYQESRNRTAHEYNEEAAIKVLHGLKDFYEEMLFLLNALEERSKDETEI